MADRLDDMAKVLTVADLLRVLADHPPDLPIYLADWNEEYAEDWPLVAEKVCVLDQRPVRDKLGNLLFEQPRRLCLGVPRRQGAAVISHDSVTERPEDAVACPVCGKGPGDSCDGPASHPSRLVHHVKVARREYLPSGTSVTCDCGATLRNDAERSAHFAETGHRDGTIVKETKKA